MKPKKVTVERKETLAYDNHQLHVAGDGICGILQLSDRTEYEKIEQGATITITPAGKKEKEYKQFPFRQCLQKKRKAIC